MNNLASTYGGLGLWNEAEELFVQVMEMRKRVLGQEHPDTLVSVNNLELTYRSDGMRLRSWECRPWRSPRGYLTKSIQIP